MLSPQKQAKTTHKILSGPVVTPDLLSYRPHMKNIINQKNLFKWNKYIEGVSWCKAFAFFFASRFFIESDVCV